jgi:hypothetical protein
MHFSIHLTEFDLTVACDGIWGCPLILQTFISKEGMKTKDGEVIQWQITANSLHRNRIIS